MLTHKQYDLLRYIDDRMKAGAAPSFDEMLAAMEMKSKSEIHRVLTALEERGFIRRRKGYRRAIDILKLPDAFRHKPSGADGLVAVPVMGQMRETMPLKSLDRKVRDLMLAPGMLGSGDHFAVEVAGDYLSGAGISDGDMAILCTATDATNGDIALAVMDGRVMVLRRFRRQGEAIAMEAANDAYEPRILPWGRVSVRGRLVGVYRKY